MSCLCPQCTDTPAPTYEPEYFHQCEVRWVANLPNDRARSLYLHDVKEARGFGAYQKLRTDTWTELQRRANSTKPTST